MKKLLLLLTLAFTITANAQDDKTVTLTVSGQGKTQDEAKQVALRSAIEQAFGAFISSKTEILNDHLVKDEIVSITNGNIQKFDVLSEVQLPDGGYATTLKAVVSVTKLTSFCESKGVEVEFKGGLFAANIKIQKLNEDAEYKAILSLCEVSREILSKSIDYSLDVSEPVSHNGSNDDFIVNLSVECKQNKNMELFYEYFHKTLSGIIMNRGEIENYNKVQKVISYVINYTGKSQDNLDTLCLRNPNSLLALKNLMIKSNEVLLNFRIKSEVDTIIVNKCCNINYRGDFYNPGSGTTSTHEIDKWYITAKDLKWGFPAAGKIKKEGIRYPKVVFDEAYIFSTGKMYVQALAETNKPSILSEDETYYTATNFYLSKYKINGYGWGGDWSEWLNNKGDAPLVIFNTPSYLFSFTYQHMVKIQKLEKITKYKIEPWENKLN